ncbi:MAG: lipopolysaccharide heptosyltransferase II [Nitrospinae bacterium]|nr:lipopolysaccharide heptosyltransferase II [Nitrospinota bacterium]
MSARGVLVRAPNWLGDCIMAMPALAGLKKADPDARLTLAIHEPFAALGGLAPFVDETVPLPGQGDPRRGEVLRGLRRRDFDTLIVLPNSFRSAWDMWPGSAKRRLGYGGSLRSFMLTHAPARPLRHSLHQTEYFARLIGTLYPNAAPCAFEPSIPEEARNAAAKLAPGTGPLIGVGFGASYGSAKMWPAERFGALIERLSALGEVVLLGAQGDRAVEQATLAATKARPLSLVGRTPLDVLAAVFERLAAYVTNDTGPMHLAAALGTPVVCLFGPTSPDETRPLGAHVSVLYHRPDCAPCWRRDCPTDHRCMAAITVDETLGAVKDVMRL